MFQVSAIQEYTSFVGKDSWFGGTDLRGLTNFALTKCSDRAVVARDLWGKEPVRVFFEDGHRSFVSTRRLGGAQVEAEEDSSIGFSFGRELAALAGFEPLVWDQVCGEGAGGAGDLSGKGRRYDCRSSLVAELVASSVRTGRIQTRYYRSPPNTTVQLIESAKVVVDLSRQKVLHLLTHYSEEFMAHFFTDLDTPQSAERICDIMFQRCPHVWSFNNLTSGTECTQRLLALPLFNNGKYADGNSRACRLIHSVMTESVGGRNSAAGSGAGGSHCEHLSFVPMADSKGRIKCQGRGRGLPFGMGFTEDELEMVQNYGDRTFFAGRSIGGGEGGGNYRSSSNNSGTSPRSSSPGSVLSEDAVVEERRSGRTSAARLGYRLIPPAGAPEEHQQLVQVQDEKTALTAWQHGLCPSFVRMWTDRADGRVHSPGQTTERTNQSSGPPILSRGGPIYGDATSDPNQVFFEELGGKRLYFTYDLGYLPFDVHVDGFGPGGIHAVCSSSTADFSTTGGDPVEVDVGGARPAHTLRREEKRLHTLVLLHGFPHYHIAWKRISTLLLSKGMQENHTRYNLVAFNLPGYYLSSASRDLRRMRLVSVAKAFFAAFRQMGLGAEGKPITLIGHDWGGAVAWAMLHLIAVPSSHPSCQKRPPNNTTSTSEQCFRPNITRAILMNAPHPHRLVSLAATNATQHRAIQYAEVFARSEPRVVSSSWATSIVGTGDGGPGAGLAELATQLWEKLKNHGNGTIGVGRRKRGQKEGCEDERLSRSWNVSLLSEPDAGARFRDSLFGKPEKTYIPSAYWLENLAFSQGLFDFYRANSLVDRDGVPKLFEPNQAPIRTPVHILWGREDQYFILKNIEKLERYFVPPPASTVGDPKRKRSLVRIHELDGLGHSPHLEDPDGIAALIEDIVRGVSERSRSEPRRSCVVASLGVILLMVGAAKMLMYNLFLDSQSI